MRISRGRGMHNSKWRLHTSITIQYQSIILGAAIKNTLFVVSVIVFPLSIALYWMVRRDNTLLSWVLFLCWTDGQREKGLANGVTRLEERKYEWWHSTPKYT